MSLLTFTDRGIYCPQADVYIDPWKRVEKAVITHAHSDHARWGMGAYLSHYYSAPILRQRLGQDIRLQTVGYGETRTVNGVHISLHPAGHIPGSAQVRLEYQGEIWVVSGDYKVVADGISTPFEPVRCHTFITESTFGLPVYRWQPQEEVIGEIHDWWQANAEAGKASLLIGYALGKAQRLLQYLRDDIGPVYVHGAIALVQDALRSHGVPLRAVTQVTPDIPKEAYRKSLIVAPPNAIGSAWTRKFGAQSLGMASGWMSIRGARRRRAADRGFVLSDHADWDELNQAVEATGASQVFVTHGYSDLFARWLREKGLDAGVVETQFEGELSEINESGAEPDPEVKTETAP